MFAIIQEFDGQDLLLARRKSRRDAFALARCLREQAKNAKFYVRRIKPARKQGRKKF